MQKQYLKASTTPLVDIKKIAYEGQNPKMMQYQRGYEFRFEQMPIIKDRHDVNTSGYIMENIADQLRMEQKVRAKEWNWINDNFPVSNEFDRFIIGLEEPIQINNGYIAGKELVVARWGKGFTSPVHGHARGFMHEEVISGKVKVHTYRLMNNGTSHSYVIPFSTEIFGAGTIVSEYTPLIVGNDDRDILIHNFEALEDTVTLHYLPEHTRDRRDNTFSVKFFDELVHLDGYDVQQITSKDAMYSNVGDVILVRSTNVSEYGDHYIVITGHPVVKEHGLRPQEIAIQAPRAVILDKYEPIMGVTLLKLKHDVKMQFLNFHGIGIRDNKVILPQL